MNVLYLHLRLDAPRYTDVIADAALKQTMLPGTVLGVTVNDENTEAVVKMVDFDRKRFNGKSWRGAVLGAYGPEDIGTVQKIVGTAKWRDRKNPLSSRGK